MTLTEFLLARIEDDRFKSRCQLVEGVATRDFNAVWDATGKTVAADLIRLRAESRRFSALIAANLGVLGGWCLRQWASEYSSHPDYRGEWKP